MKRKTAMMVTLLALLPKEAASQGAENLYQQACDEGDMIACNVFGLMLEQGDGVSMDVERAATLYEIACERGTFVGCTNLGILYEAGAGVERSPERAEGLFRVACEGGELLACNILGPGARVTGVSLERFSKVGRVEDARTGNTLGETIIDLPELGVRVISDDLGRIQLPGLPPGQHRITAERAGYINLEGQLEVPGNPQFRLVLNRSDGDPLEPGRIEGRIEGELEDELSDVDITIRDQDGIRALSNSQGRYVLRNVEPGLVDVTFARLGYAPRTAMMIVHPGRTVEVSTQMVSQPIELAAIEVTVGSAFLEESGFFRRARGGQGTQFTPMDMERINPFTTSDLIQRVPGIDYVYDQDGEHAVSRRRQAGADGSPCILPVYVDGTLEIDADLNRWEPDQIAAIEFYNAVETPIQYLSSRNACGVVLIWSKR